MMLSILNIIAILLILLIILYAIITKNCLRMVLPFVILIFNLLFFVYSGFIPMSRMHRFYPIIILIVFSFGFMLLYGTANIIIRTMSFEIKKAYMAVILAIITTSYFVILFSIFFEYAVMFISE